MNLANIFKSGTEGLDKLFTSDDERLNKAELLMKIDMMNQKHQLDYQKLELKTGDKYVTRWRPTLGWVCSLGFLGIMIYELVLKMIFPSIPAISTNVYNILEWIIPILFGIRSAEKIFPYIGIKK